MIQQQLMKALTTRNSVAIAAAAAAHFFPQDLGILPKKTQKKQANKHFQLLQLVVYLFSVTLSPSPAHRGGGLEKGPSRVRCRNVSTGVSRVASPGVFSSLD